MIDTEARYAPGDGFDVLNLTTGYTHRYEILRDLGFDEFLVRVTVGLPRRPGSPYLLRGSRHVVYPMGGPTLAVLQESGLL